ncbi:MAG: VCBS repeat-containing protein [Chitinophagaceae bacterium]|nr:VCBS repeat-containing protein [Chitinophagaceae bacterium]
MYQKKSCIHLFYITAVALLLQVFTACKTKEHKEADNNSPRVTALSYLWDGRFDEAEVAFKKAIKTDKDNILNYIDLSLLYLARNSYSDVEKQVQDGLSIQPGHTELKLILAEAYIQQNNTKDAEKELNEVLGSNPGNIVAYYMLTGIMKTNKNSEGQKSGLLKVLEISPANLPVRLQLAELFATENKTDSCLFYLQSVKKIAPEFPLVVDTVYQKAIAFLQGDQPSKALYFIQRFHKLMETTRVYANGFAEIEPPAFPGVKSEFNDSRFGQTDNRDRAVTLNDIQFTEVAEKTGLITQGTIHATQSVLALADDDGTGNTYIYAGFTVPGSPPSRYLFKRDFGTFNDISSSVGMNHTGDELDAAFADYDNDGYQDLFISTTRGIIIYKNRGDGNFSRVKKNTGLENITDGSKLLIADFDQDGDLDLYIAGKKENKFFRNNSDGSFTEQAKAMNLGAGAGIKDMDFGDWDADGDLDIAVVLSNGSVQLFNNERYSKFSDLTDSLDLKNPALKGSAIGFGDYNNDGLPDLFIAGVPNGNSFLLKNTGKNGYITDPASEVFSSSLKNTQVFKTVFTDFDNDGHEDILVVGTGMDGTSRGIQLFHNDSTKGFSNVSHILPEAPLHGMHIAIADFNLDGDDDIFLTSPDGIKLIRNDGGNLNHYMQVQLTGLSYGNNKNNRFGIGAQVELKSGDLYQLKTIKRALTNFGVGGRDSLEAVRIIWPNGAPQFISDPSRKQKLIEEEKLKGSCPFLFVWNGREYEFLKDMMWRSALGMPLAVNGKDTMYAFSDASKEYLLIPGEKLKPRDNTYSIKITEELWEAVYFDKAALVAVDHPDSVDVFADERFVLPPFPGKKVYPIANKHYPVSATDDRGNDVRSKILAYDFRYISNFTEGKYQGLAEDHDLVLDLGAQATNGHLLLFLRGWTFPTDASINASMAQSAQYKVAPPCLQVINQKGEWQTVIPDIGFPMGKDKMVIVDLKDKFLTPDNRKIRIRTNMQLYWDEIFYSNGTTQAPVNMHDLAMIKAGLSFRGYSDSYRKGGPFGPHWFDYYNTSGGQQWRDLTGYYTRYGDVLPLLQEADDEYIICNSGDEITIDFDARSLPALPKGWKRDFLVYSEGWVKDGDLNTAHGQTVEPLPFHNMPSYPYKNDSRYPFEKHKAYMQKYNTRKVSTDDFKNALKPKTGMPGGQ